jgi:hypothetical protein
MVEQDDIITPETIIVLKDLGETIRKICSRLLREGFVIHDGQIYKPEEKHDNA